MQIRRIWDLTLPLDDKTVLYPGDPKPRIEQTHAIDRGDSLTMSVLQTGCHVGTHVDAPAHFLAGGASIDSISLNRLVGPAMVCDLSGADFEISCPQLEELSLQPGRHLLFKTRFGPAIRDGQFPPAQQWLNLSAVKYLLNLQPLSLGWDCYSVDPVNSTAFPAHRALAAADVPIAVCLNLTEVPTGNFFYLVAPLRLTGAEAAPARALLLDFDTD